MGKLSNTDYPGSFRCIYAVYCTILPTYLESMDSIASYGEVIRNKGLSAKDA